ncbi:MAG: PH domain-containing protein [Lachnospiraceae bacterium]|nr:PH domain-containing protein [Lachnospiraceae bacterium]
MEKYKRDSIWRDRKRTFLGLPWSFTVYELTEDRLFVKTGFFTINEEEIRLYRVMDVQYKATFGQRLFGVGSIYLTTSDKSAHDLEIRSVKRPRDVKELLSSKVEEQRLKNRVVGREMMGMADGDNDDLDDEVTEN